MAARAPPFVIKLRVLLDSPKYRAALSWDDSGTVVVVNKLVFRSLILGKVFKSAKFKSFVRQMNLHGFRQTATPSTSKIQGFRCTNFVRDDKDGVLQASMERKASKSGTMADECQEVSEEQSDLTVQEIYPALATEILKHETSCARRRALEMICASNALEVERLRSMVPCHMSQHQVYEETWLQ